MKRSGFKQKLTVPLKRTPFKRKPPKAKKNKKLKRDLMPNRIKSAIKRLKLISHTFVRSRDSYNPDYIKGKCFDCDEEAEGGNFQAGHFVPDSVSGILLRYHPWNMHGQAGGCNMKYRQEQVKINYTLRMLDKYGKEKFDQLMALKNKKDKNGLSLRADIFFYEKMIELYRAGDEQAIVDYLHSYEYMV